MAKTFKFEGAIQTDELKSSADILQIYNTNSASSDPTTIRLMSSTANPTLIDLTASSMDSASINLSAMSDSNSDSSTGITLTTNGKIDIKNNFDDTYNGYCGSISIYGANSDPVPGESYLNLGSNGIISLEGDCITNKSRPI